jgi:hypothetical protein
MAATLQSRVFPGLCLSVEALLAQDSARVLQAFQTGMQTPAHAAFVARLRQSGQLSSSQNEY